MNVLWHLWRGNWDCSLLRQSIEQLGWNEYEGTLAEHKARGLDSAVVIFGFQEDATELIDLLNSLKNFLFIYVSDECNRLDFSQLPTHGKIWTQCWTTARQPVHRHLLLGARYDTKQVIENLNKDKKYLWSFVGQTQASRIHTYNILERTTGGKMIKTEGFGGSVSGLSYPEYLQIFCNSKIVACPMGNNCPDTFRMYEAIEAGALPICEGADYWKEFNIPFPCVNDWKELQFIVNDYELNPDKLIRDTEKAVMWWKDYQRKVISDLQNDTQF